MFGTLILGAQQAPMFSISQIAPDDFTTGDHCSGRYSGKYELIDTETFYEEVSIPSRDKHLDLYLSGAIWSSRAEASPSTTLKAFSELFATLDSEYVGESWLAKLEKVRMQMSGSRHALMINTTSTHGSFSFLSSKDPIYLLGVYDPQLKTAHLVWSTDEDIDRRVRAMYPLKLYLYRFPVIVDRALFIPTQTICAHWYKYCKSKNEILFAFNALELKLFKEGASYGD